MIKRAALQGLRVVEIGERIAAGACGSVLGALGAEVTLVGSESSARQHKWVDRIVAMRDKRIVRAGPTDGVVAPLLADADVVITASDVTPVPDWRHTPRQIVCDITAYGSSGPMAGLPHPDQLIQAVTGLADTTGEPASPPALTGFPVTEGIGALYAAAGIIAALRVRARDGVGQDIEIALYDCAYSTLTTFLPFHIVGKPVRRSGNRHVLAAPWNVYKASDGWVVLCTGTDEQWKRLCAVIGRPELAAHPDYRHTSDRVAHCDAVDAAVQDWIGEFAATECVERLQGIEISCGPIVTVEALAREPNLAHRGTIVPHPDPDSGGQALVMNGVIKAGRKMAATPVATREPREAAAEGSPWQSHGPADRRPFAGIRVLEIGQFTTAPLAARQLAALGAEVLKIESPGGDGSRGWAPQQGGQGYFFTFSNSDKRSLALDLRHDADRAQFESLVAQSDVLVENLKPGALARLGLDAQALSAINPQLVYCGISGFGADSAYAGRPAFDTVVQAMSGIMDLTRVNGVPQKVGISLVDILGGVFGLIATSAALLARDATGAGEHIDLSMQDAAAWITQWSWRGHYPPQRAVMIACSDGYVAALLTESEELALAALRAATPAQTRAQLVSALAQSGYAAAPVLTVSEAATSAQSQARSLMVYGADASGQRWPLLSCPIRLSRTPAVVQRPIGRLGEANEEIARRHASAERV